MRILVIDDQHDTLASMVSVLEDYGHEVLTAEHGQEAIAVLSRIAPPELIFLDLMMPVMNGWQFRRWQQAQRGLASVPVVLLSASTTIEVTAELLDVAGYLRKPVELESLLLAVSRLGAPSAAR